MTFSSTDHTSYNYFRTAADEYEYERYIHSLWADYDEHWEEAVQGRLLDQYNFGMFYTSEQWDQLSLYEFEIFPVAHLTTMQEEQLEELLRNQDDDRTTEPVQEQVRQLTDRPEQE